MFLRMRSNRARPVKRGAIRQSLILYPPPPQLYSQLIPLLLHPTPPQLTLRLLLTTPLQPIPLLPHPTPPQLTLPDTTADLKAKVKEQSEEILNVLPSNDDWRLELRYIVRDVCELDLTIGANGSLTKAIKKIISDSGQIHTADQRSKDKLLSHVIVEITSVIEAECTTIVTSKVSLLSYPATFFSESTASG